MKPSRSYTGSRQSVGLPTLNKAMYFQLIRVIRKGEKNAKDSTRRKVRKETASD